MVGQDRELAQKRVVEERRTFALETGRALLSILDQAIDRVEDGRRGPGALSFGFQSGPLPGFVGELRGGRLRLPWENDPASVNGPADSEGLAFAADLRLVEKAEFEAKNPAKAVALGQALLKTGLNPDRKAAIRLAVARSLAKAGRDEEAKAVDRSLLALAAEVQDEFQIPFSLYAAERLVNSASDHPAIVATLDPAVYPWGRLAAGAALQGRDLFAKLEASSNAEVKKRSGAASAALRELIKKQEQAILLKDAFPFSDGNDGRPEKTESGAESWTLFGSDPWFVISLEANGGRGILITCEARAALENALAIAGGAATSTAGTALVGLQIAEGLPLGPAFSNARIVFPAAMIPPASVPANSRSTLYLLMGALALGLAVFGSILYGSAVRRDMKTAELRSQFVASVSHELRTPLAAIRMFADTLRLNRVREPEKRDEYLETISHESERLDRLIANVLDFSKIEKGRRIYRFVSTSLPEILASAGRAMAYPLRRKGFRLRIAAAENLPDIQADGDALLQAVMNLLDNAVKYSGESRDIDLVLEKGAAEAIIRVRDRGIGIPEAEQKRVFEKFYRVPDPRNEGLVGAGLGLSLAAHIVEAHGGRIEVRSRPGEGSEFAIILPLENRG